MLMKPHVYILRFGRLQEIPSPKLMEEFIEMLIDWRYTLRNIAQKDRVNDYLSNILSEYDKFN